MTNHLIRAGLAPLCNGLARLTRRDASSLSVCFTSTEKIVQFVASFLLCFFFFLFSLAYRLIPSASNSTCSWKRKGIGEKKTLEQVGMLKKRGNKEKNRKRWRSAVSWRIVHRKQLLLARSGDTV